jgi:hypothetical protein
MDAAARLSSLRDQIFSADARTEEDEHSIRVSDRAMA